MALLKVLGLDPGRTTGWCLASVFLESLPNKRGFSNAGGQTFGDRIEVLDFGQFTMLESSMREFGDRVAGFGVGVVVYEDFVNYGGKSHVGATWATGLSPVYVTGWLRGYLCGKLDGNVQWVPQMASEAKGLCTNTRLKQAGMWFVGQQHARDAARHVWVYARKHVHS